MQYCTRCVYPETSAVGLVFDERGICSGCQTAEEKERVDWQERGRILEDILEQYRLKDGSNYDCLIPVSGGKDSHFQTYLIKEVYGLNPLLVTFNHTFNTEAGIRNLANLITRFGVDHLRFTPNPQLIKRLARLSLEKMGDMCWHCHAGIYTYPVQVAVKYKIPLIIWGEQGFMDLGGMFSFDDMVEMTNKFRREHGLRGYDYEDMISDEYEITAQDLRWAMYPSDEEIDAAGVRGIYIGNFVEWNGKKQTELMIEKYGFETACQERTYNTYENVECPHCSGAHDYLKYLKFGYGRATDHASQDIRLHRMTREEGIGMVEKYDGKRPADLDTLLRFLDMSEAEFTETVDRQRDPRAWRRQEDGSWLPTDTVGNHRNDPGVEEARLPKTEEADYIVTGCLQRNEPGGYRTI